MAIGALVKFTAKPGATNELMGLLTDVIADVRTEPGNLLAVTLSDPNEPAKIYLFEIYKDQAALEAHRAAAHTKEKGPKVQALFAEPMQTQFFETVDWPGALKVAG